MERILSILLVASTTVARKVVILDDNEWDSVVVTTSPVKITNSRFNSKNTTKDHTPRMFEPSDKARMIKDCEEGDIKCLYDSHLAEENPKSQDTIEKFLEKYSSVTNVKINDELRNNSGKAYWNQIDAEKHKHPYDDTKGWVTLDPIPYSTSTVSKWKPKYPGDRPWSHGPPQHHPTSSQLWVTSNLHNSDKRPSTHWGVASNDIITDNKPNGFPLDSSPYPSRPQPTYHPPSPQNPAIPHGYQPLDHSHYPPHPYYPPQSQQNHYTFPNSQHYQPPVEPQYPPAGHFPLPQPSYTPITQPPHSWHQTPFSNKPPHSSHYYGNEPTYTSAAPGRPTNYPDEGQGEWVLLSTTKGYSLPQRYHDRKMHVKQSMGALAEKSEIISRSLKSKYQENDIDDKFMLLSKSPDGNRKSDDAVELGQTLWNVDGINILEARKPEARNQKSAWPDKSEMEEEKVGKPEITFKRTVRLTVLPALNNTSTLSHDGMLEVDSNPQSVDEAQREEERMKKLQQMAVVSTGRQQFNVVPVVPRGTSQDFNKKRAAVLAAVGAGLIPATMAVLLPVALGRRRRSVEEDLPEIPKIFTK